MYTLETHRATMKAEMDEVERGLAEQWDRLRLVRGAVPTAEGWTDRELAEVQAHFEAALRLLQSRGVRPIPMLEQLADMPPGEALQEVALD